jgi:methyltransferase
MIFTTVLILLIAERIYELRLAKRNTQKILEIGGIEFGRNHYWVMIALHSLFFFSLLLESILRGVHPPFIWFYLLLVFIAVQYMRAWIIKSMNGRWTTRVLVIPNETLVSKGPFRYFSHPNYWVVAIEILIFPMIFGLYYTAILFTLLNAMVILFIRLPVEKKALKLAHH